MAAAIVVQADERIGEAVLGVMSDMVRRDTPTRVANLLRRLLFQFSPAPAEALSTTSSGGSPRSGGSSCAGMSRRTDCPVSTSSGTQVAAQY